MPRSTYDEDIHLDIETYSESDLKREGLYKYAEDESSEIQVICYAKGDGPVHVWITLEKEKLPRSLVRTLQRRMDPGAELHISSTKCPDMLVRHANKGGKFRAHNSQFERIMLNSHAGKAIGFPATGIKQWICTAAKMASHSIPRALGNAARVLGTEAKNEVGKQDMLALCKPRSGKITRYTPENDPERYLRFYLYCVDDVKAERGIDKVIPDLSPMEQRVFEMDQRINDRGIRVDVEAVQNVQILIKEYKRFLEKRCVEWTGFRPTQTEKLSNWIRERYDILDLQAPTIKEALKDESCPHEVKRVLRLRNLHSMKAVSKYDAIERAIMVDEHLRGMFLYHGAATGRWSSMIVQLQNLFRPVIDDPNTAIEAFSTLDLEWIKSLYDKDPMKVFASCVRGMLLPEVDEDIIGMDFSAIEARVVAWLAGQDDILAVFAEHGLIYEYVAAQIYGMSTDVATLKAMKKTHPDRRFIGKIAVLALGYQGGKKAFAKMAKTYGVEIPEDQAEQIKKDWRKANTKIVGLWYDMEEAAIAAVQNPGAVYAIPNKKIMFKKEGEFLYMRLPSGRRLAYYKPQINKDGQLTYLGINTYTRQWCRVTTYGGKLTENAVQAISRDLLVAGMFNLEGACYIIIGTVHDEVILSVPRDKGSMAEIEALLCKYPKWARGLPIRAEGFRGRRYRK